MHRGVGQFTSGEKWRLKSYYLPPMSHIPYTKICVSIIQRQREMLLAPLEEMLLAFLEEMLLASWGIAASILGEMPSGKRLEGVF